MRAPPGHPLVTLEQASVTLGGAPVLRDLSLRLRAGDRLAVLGANGSGKTSLLRLLRGDQWLDPARPGRRTFHLPEDPQESPIGARERMALCSPEDQDAYLRREVDLTVEAVIRSGLDGALYPVTGTSPRRAALVRAAAEALGVAHLLDRSFLTLSRGEGRKVLVARALAPDPEVLLLDEVCDGLDLPSRAALLSRLAAVAAGGTTVVTAVHRTEELFDGIDRALWLDGGRIAAVGAPGHVVRRWRKAFERRVDRGHDPDRDRGHDRDRDPDRDLDRDLAPDPDLGHDPTRDLFTLRRVTVRVDGVAVLGDLTWQVRRGEAWAVTGPNGAGKSTLLRLLAGEEQPASGRIDRLDQGPRADAGALRGRVGQVSPELQARHRFDATGQALVLSGFRGTIGLAGAATRFQRARAAAILDELGLVRLARRRILSCSYGELRLLLLARALVAAPEVLLLDEPFAGLDPGARRAMGAAMARLARAGTGLVLVTHHEDEVPAALARRARLEGGRLGPLR